MKQRVLITREPVRAGPLLEALQAQGIEAFAEPVTRTVSLASGQKLPDLGRFSWIAFTSVNGVVAFAETLEQHGRSLPDGAMLAAVGAATADELRRRLRPPDLVPRKSAARDLARAILERADTHDPGPLLWPCARNARPDFLEAVQQSRTEVHPWVCYATEAVPPELLGPRLKQAAPWHVAVFAAPSAVKAFHAAWPAPWSFSCVAIGPTTEKALKAAGVAPEVSAGTGLEALLQAVLRSIGGNKAITRLSQ